LAVTTDSAAAGGVVGAAYVEAGRADIAFGCGCCSFAGGSDRRGWGLAAGGVIAETGGACCAFATVLAATAAEADRARKPPSRTGVRGGWAGGWWC